MTQATKRILFVHSSSDLYGASRIFLITVTLAKKAGHQPHVVLTSEGPLSQELQKIGVPVTFIHLGILRRKYMNIAGMLNRFWVIAKAVVQLSRLIRNKHIDLVYSNTCGVFAPAVASWFLRVPHLFHVHEVIERPRVFGKFTALFMRALSQQNIVVSEAVKKSWENYVPNLQLAVIHNGLEYEKFLNVNTDIRSELNVESDELLVGMIARVHFWKGQTYFLEIARHLLNQGVRAKFLMVGDAFPGYEYLYSEINNKKTELDLGDHIIDLGFREDIPAILNTLDLLILPSTSQDPLPTVVLEAMASGKPVAGTAHGGATEMIVDQETGVLIPWDNSLIASEKIVKVIRNSDSLTEMGQKARERVLQNFSLDSYERNILKVLAK